jgi:hypothetical protein
VIYALPDMTRGPELPPRLGGGWQPSGIVTLQSGSPFTPVLGTDRTNIGAGPA